MSKIYNAAEAWNIDKAVDEITAMARSVHRDGGRFVTVPLYKNSTEYEPLIQRLEELGYDLDYLPATFQGKGELTITWQP